MDIYIHYVQSKSFLEEKLGLEISAKYRTKTNIISKKSYTCVFQYALSDFCCDVYLCAVQFHVHKCLEIIIKIFIYSPMTERKNFFKKFVP